MTSIRGSEMDTWNGVTISWPLHSCLPNGAKIHGHRLGPVLLTKRKRLLALDTMGCRTAVQMITCPGVVRETIFSIQSMVSYFITQ
ncbi:hypothetical protein DPMN_109902 [Dreissena polymorpha]|uniref:Uncharacterized protein n=1 Tax=Dreissena polymorpha TaxID=45954 RepID=A0A9D4KBK2_DREPO|nr:hypothetical protein DPMN_109902 [Dreissena polymorpha]